MNSEIHKKIIHALDFAVEDRIVPGMQLTLGRKDECLGTFFSGVRNPLKGLRVHQNTWFDLASLTKVISTVTLIVLARQRGKLRSYTEPLSEIFPEWIGPLKEKTVLDLLNHRSGCPAVFEATNDLPTREEKVRFFLSEVDKMPLRAEPIYSDVGYMILGIALERLMGRRLREIWIETFGIDFEIEFSPRDSEFDWLKGLVGRPTIAGISAIDDPTEWLTGRSQDPRAQWLEGDAGHAGLFGTSTGVELWAQRIFRAYHGKDNLISDKAIRELVNFDSESTRWLGGFDRPTPPSQSGSLFPPQTVGHLGFTGASFWMDLESGFRVTLLTHRFAPNFDPEKLRTWRPTFHDWIWKEVFSKL